MLRNKANQLISILFGKKDFFPQKKKNIIFYASSTLLLFPLDKNQN